VGLLAVHPEDLGAGLLDDLAFFLDGGCIDPVLGVADAGLAAPLGGDHAVDRGQGLLAHLLLGERAAAEVVGPVAEIAGQRLLDDREGVALKGRHGDLLVGHGRHQDVDDVHLVDEPLERPVHLDASLPAVRLGHVGVDGVDARHVHVDAVDAPEGLVMKVGGKARAHHARANRFAFHGRPPCPGVRVWLAKRRSIVAEGPASGQREKAPTEAEGAAGWPCAAPRAHGLRTPAVPPARWAVDCGLAIRDNDRADVRGKPLREEKRTRQARRETRPGGAIG